MRFVPEDIGSRCNQCIIGDFIRFRPYRYQLHEDPRHRFFPAQWFMLAHFRHINVTECPVRTADRNVHTDLVRIADDRPDPLFLHFPVYGFLPAESAQCRKNILQLHYVGTVHRQCRVCFAMGKLMPRNAVLYEVPGFLCGAYQQLILD